MNIIASIQARMSSTRLFGKVLKEICGKPMLLWQIERIKKSRLIDEVIVATTMNPRDDRIVEFCTQHNIKYFRGSEEDVTGRIASLIKKFAIDIHVEFCGDSPFADAHIIDETVGFFLKNNQIYDFVTNSIKTTYPPGLEVTVYNGKTLLEANEIIAKDDPLREHASIYISLNKDRYRVCNLEAPDYYYYPDIYLEVDTCEDLCLIRNIANYFYSRGIKYFSLSQILDYLKDNRNLIEINSKVKRRWKQFREDDV